MAKFRYDAVLRANGDNLNKIDTSLFANTSEALFSLTLFECVATPTTLVTSTPVLKIIAMTNHIWSIEQ